MLRRRCEPRPRAVHAVVLAGRHAGSPGRRRSYDAAAKTYTVNLSQSLAPTPGQPAKEPMVIPLKLGLVGGRRGSCHCALAAAGPRRRDRLTKPAETFVFAGCDGAAGPVAQPRLLRAGEAHRRSVGRRPRFFAAHDSDPFNRWQALQTLAMRAPRRQCRRDPRRAALPVRMHGLHRRAGRDR